MDGEFVNLTPEDIGSERLCCVIRSKTAHPGVEAKRARLTAALDKLRQKSAKENRS